MERKISVLPREALLTYQEVWSKKVWRTGLHLRLPGSFRRRAFHADLLMPQGALFARGAHSMQAVMHRALLRRGRSGRYHSLLREMLPAGNQCRIRQKGGNGSWRSSIIR